MKKQMKLFFKRHPQGSMVCTLVFFISVEAMFSFCTKIDCPGFVDAEFEAWFPYHEQQQLHFETQDSKKDTITISSIEKNKPHWAYSTESCDMNARIVGDSEGNSVLYVSYLKLSDVKHLDLYLFGTDFQGGGVTESEPDFNYDGNIVTTYPSLTLNGKLFSDVVAVEVEPSAFAQARIKTPTIKKFWLAKGQGIIAFEKYPTDGVWVKQ